MSPPQHGGQKPRLAVVLSVVLPAALVILGLFGYGASAADHQHPLHNALDQARYRSACPDYKSYSTRAHPPQSDGRMALPFQRPARKCRTFESLAVEEVIETMKERMVDKDLARLFENAFPNTLDTTVRWHVDGRGGSAAATSSDKWQGAQSFIVTGDINAEWLRDSTNQLAQYQVLAKKDTALEKLILGAINTQAEFVIEAPYCNAFQPPPPSKLPPSSNGMNDVVHPAYEPSSVFECKYEVDSLAHFLSISNQFNSHTGSTAFLTPRWYMALDTLLETIKQQSRPTFDKHGDFQRNEYTFQRRTDSGTETLNLNGIGNPLKDGTGLIRSAFRPSDDATILGFFIPGNAMLAVELKRTAEMLKKASPRAKGALAQTLDDLAESIRLGVWEHGVVQHKTYGPVFAFEVDGYGSHILMDDANLPSLLALPLLGFVDRNDPTYRNTRRMVLEKEGNPYFLQGREFAGIGGPHIGLRHAWPMSLLVRSMTSDDDEEIMEAVGFVKGSSVLGLVHESVDVNHVKGYTRSWFAWANSVFAQTMLDLARRKPHLLFGKGAEPLILE